MNYGHFLSIANYYLFDKNGDFYNKKSTSSVITNEVLYFFYSTEHHILYSIMTDKKETFVTRKITLQPRTGYKPFLKLR